MDEQWLKELEEASKNDPLFIKNDNLSLEKKKLMEKYASCVERIKDDNKAIDYTLGFAYDHKLTSDDMRGYIPVRVAYATIPDIFSMIDATPDFPVE